MLLELFAKAVEGRQVSTTSLCLAAEAPVTTGLRWITMLEEEGLVCRESAITDARLTNVVVDRGVRIPDGLVVGEDPEQDAARFRRTEAGICLITQPMIDRLG